MEFPHLGQFCGNQQCKQLDFLPMKCDSCDGTFCKDHITYDLHSCPAAYRKNVQVPVCPLCNKPIPVNRGELPDIKVGQHIDSDCQSDPAKAKRNQIYTNACSKKGCKKKELVPILCQTCRLNYCLKHRHTEDHSCQGFQGSGKAISNPGAAAVGRQKQSSEKSAVASSSRAVNNPVPQGMSEDEALALAMHMSLNDHHGAARPSAASSSLTTQEEADRMLALSLQQGEENNPRRAQTATGNDKKSCIVT